ncbi:MAG: peptide chain release factor N(5)-glutamine methyltransferase [Clostridia bacterium]|nr:peptide chain release factor N(5)-glutamine methyltransferase [Clostridia bacterium]
MQKQDELSFKKCFKSNNINTTKKQIYNLIKNLTDYVEGEERFLICKTLNIKTQDLLLLKQFENAQLKKLKKVTKKRIMGIPLNKILKKEDFYLDGFVINKHVLAPRKETEILVEQSLKQIENSQKDIVRVLDLCCGSGVIGLSVAKHSKKKVFVVLTDKSKKALRIAQKNLKDLQIKNAKIVCSDMFSRLKNEDKFDIIISNPPYIQTSQIKLLHQGVVKYDPKMALDGGEDGLKFYKIIAQNLQDHLVKNGTVLLEIGFDQADQVSKLFKDQKFCTKVLKDYSKNDRIVIAKQ